MATGIIRFGGFELDRGAYQLRRGGRVVHLERIPLEMLFLLAERAGALVERREIIAKIWGGEVFVDTDNSINTAIRKIRNALQERGGAPVIETVPAKGYRFVAPVKREAGRPQAVGEDRARPAMLVVLPFANLSDDPKQEYFSDGLTEETIANLGQLASGRLGVIARTSAMAYKGSRKSIAEIGKELGVNFVLEGSVRCEKRKVRVTAQLIRVSDQTHLWAQHYERDLKQLLALQDELGRAIAGQVEIKLAPGSAPQPRHAGAVNEQAYDFYLRGLFHIAKATRPHLERGIEYFREATKIDPSMAVAFAGMAEAYNVLPITSDAVAGESFAAAERAARAALEISEDLAEAHCALAGIQFWHKWDWRACEEHAKRALAGNPSYANAHLRYAHLLSNIGRHEEAIAEVDQARRLDPLSLITNTHCAQFRYQAGRYEEARAILEKTFELDPNFWVAHIVLAKIYQRLGRHKEALEAAAKAHAASSGSSEGLSLMIYSHGAMGQTTQAKTLLEQLAGKSHPRKSMAGKSKAGKSHERYVPPYNLATAYLGLGETEKGLEYLERAYQERDVRMVFLGAEPRWNALAGETRFQTLLRRMGLDSGNPRR